MTWTKYISFPSTSATMKKFSNHGSDLLYMSLLKRMVASLSFELFFIISNFVKQLFDASFHEANISNCYFHHVIPSSCDFTNAFVYKTKCRQGYSGIIVHGRCYLVRSDLMYQYITFTEFRSFIRYTAK